MTTARWARTARDEDPTSADDASAPGEPRAGQASLVVLRALGLGDLLTAVPALRALAAAFPRHRRLLLAPAALATLVAEPLGYRLLDVDGVRAVPETLPAAARGCDIAVNLHGSGPQSHQALRALGPRRLIAFDPPRRPAPRGAAPSPRPRWRADEHEVLRWCRLLTESGIPADPRDLGLLPRPVPAPPAARGATIVHPGAASGARRWPVARWAAVIAAERAAGRRVAITGTTGERGLAEDLAAAARLPGDAVLAGRTTVLELAATVAGAGRIVCGDTGVAHLATALGTPSVILFGPTSPSRWGPPRDRPMHSVIWASRTGDPHAERPHDGLLAIAPDAVVAALRSLPAARANGTGTPRASLLR